MQGSSFGVAVVFFWVLVFLRRGDGCGTKAFSLLFLFICSIVVKWLVLLSLLFVIGCCEVDFSSSDPFICAPLSFGISLFISL